MPRTAPSKPPAAAAAVPETVSLWWRPASDLRGCRPAGTVVALHEHDDPSPLQQVSRLVPPQLNIAGLRGPDLGGASTAAGDGPRQERRQELRQELMSRRDQIRDWMAVALFGPVVLLGVASGGTLASALLLDDPLGYAGAALLSGTLPPPEHVAWPPGALAGVPVLLARRDPPDPPSERPDAGQPARPPAAATSGALARATDAYLTGASGALLTVRRYPPGPPSPEQEGRDVARWLTAVLDLPPIDLPDS